MSKSKNRMRDAQLEVMSRDVPRLTYNPERGITKARSQGLFTCSNVQIWKP